MQGFPDFSRLFDAFGEPVFHDVVFGRIFGEGLMMCVITAGGRVRENSRVGLLLRLRKMDFSACVSSAKANPAQIQGERGCAMMEKHGKQHRNMVFLGKKLIFCSVLSGQNDS